MNKRKFLTQLKKGLRGFPEADIRQRLAFYAEMIDDRMEEGLSEEEAVSRIGTVEDVLLQIRSETPLSGKEKALRKKGGMWKNVFLVLGSPVWLPLMISLLAVVLSLLISLWAAAISLWAVYASLIACGAAGAVGGIYFVLTGHALSGLALIAAGLVSAGLSVYFLYACKSFTKGIVLFTGKVSNVFKKILSGKEEL